MSSQKVWVAGSGKNGMAASRLMLSIGGEGVLYDSNADLNGKAV